MRTSLVVIGAALLLSGCTVVSAPEPGFTESELVEMRARVLDVRWHWTHLPDELRPPDPEVRFVSADDWATSLATCMNDAGFDNYQAVDFGLMITDVTRTADEADAASIAYYVCENSFRIVGQEGFLFNAKQLDYRYDYYSEVLIPCMALHEVEVFDAPSRAEFDDRFGFWNPYDSVTEKSVPILTTDATLFDECPSTPPGMPDDGYAAAYGH